MQKKDILKTIIRGFHTEDIPLFTRRNIELPLNSSKIITVIGPRRAGKTYLVFQHIQELISKNVRKEKILYLNFEDERIELVQNELDLILQSYRELYPEIKLSDCYFFFDEIQNLTGWERFIRRIYDTVCKNIFITGSNSRLLSSEIASSLRGRTLKYEVYPLTFREFLLFKKFNFKPEIDLFDSVKKAVLIKLFNEYLQYGGFPEIVLLEENLKLKTLQEYFEVMLYRDIAERYSVKDTLVLKYFLKRLAESVTKPYSIHKIYNELKSNQIKVGKDTLYKFIDYAEDIYMIKTLKKHYNSIIKTELAEKKAYFADTGLLAAIKMINGNNLGVLLENLVSHELSARHQDIVFFKERNECDFIVNKRDCFQICFDLGTYETKKREIAGLKEACRFVGTDKGYILTMDEKFDIKESGINILVLPVFEFILSDII
jgi:hypothetical protein